MTRPILATRDVNGPRLKSVAHDQTAFTPSIVGISLQNNTIQQSALNLTNCQMISDSLFISVQ